MSDFMREVDEEVRRERTMRLLSRYQILIVVVIVGTIVGAGVWRYTVDRRLAAAESDNNRYQAAQTLARQGAAADARKDFDALAAVGVAGYPLLARMRAAEELAASDPEAAAKRFDEIASGEGGSQAMRDAARYRGALLRVDREDPKKFEDRYGRFALDGFTFHAGMRELLALAALKRDDTAAAQRYLGEIIIDGTAPAPLRSRAQAFLELAHSGAATTSDRPAGPATVTPVAAPAASATPADPAPQTPEPTTSTPKPGTPAPATPAPATSAPVATAPH